MRDQIVNMSKNIGSLILFLKNRSDWIDHINQNIPIGCLNLSISEKIHYYINKIDHLLVCGCGNHRSYIGFKNGYRISCGNKECFVRERKKTCLEKYGVDNPKKSKDILLKEKKNILERWGGQHYMKNESIQKKFNDTMLEKWGVKWAQQSSDISDKSVKSFNENPNKEKIIEERNSNLRNKSLTEKKEIQEKKNESIIKTWGNLESFYKYRADKIKEKSIQNYSMDHHLSHPSVIKKRIDSYIESRILKIKNALPKHISYVSKNPNTNNTDSYFNLFCYNCNMNFTITRQFFFRRSYNSEEICLNCNPVIFGSSGMEREVGELISNNYTGQIMLNYKGISSELDIYLPDLNLAFEFNGLFWHSSEFKDKNFHFNKTKDCEKNGISLMHIWEDDWIYKKDIVKSIILNKIGKSKKIWARKCEIKEIKDNEIVRNFLENNHIQGFVGSKIKLGLFHENEMVSIMTFGKFRKPLGRSSTDNEFEMIRFCNKLNHSVVGGASKLFKYFLSIYNPKKVISYSDISRSNGNMYKKLGFSLSGQSLPNYYYIIDNVRKHRFGFRKDKLIKDGFDPNKTEVEIMNERGFSRIFDCGSMRWEFILNKE